MKGLKINLKKKYGYFGNTESLVDYVSISETERDFFLSITSKKKYVYIKFRKDK